MANVFFPKGAERVLRGTIDFSSAVIKAALVANTYTPNFATDEFLAGISAHVVGMPMPLTNATVTNGVFDADDVTFQAVATGATAKAVVIFRDTGAAGTSPLLAYIDDLVGFPIATNGSDITVRWDNGAQRIFSF